MKILIVGHESFPEGMLSAARMILGGKLCSVVEAIGLREAAEFRSELRDVFAKADDDWLVLADLLGGSPCNTVLEVAQEVGVSESLRVITGANLPLLLEVVLSPQVDSWDDLLARCAPRALAVADEDDSDDEL